MSNPAPLPPCPVCGQDPRIQYVPVAQYGDFVIECCDGLRASAPDNQGLAVRKWTFAAQKYIRATGREPHENYKKWDVDHGSL